MLITLCPQPLLQCLFNALVDPGLVDVIHRQSAMDGPKRTLMKMGKFRTIPRYYNGKSSQVSGQGIEKHRYCISHRMLCQCQHSSADFFLSSRHLRRTWRRCRVFCTPTPQAGGLCGEAAADRRPAKPQPRSHTRDERIGKARIVKQRLANSSPADSTKVHRDITLGIEDGPGIHKATER